MKYDIQSIIKAAKPMDPYYWEQQHLTVIRDGYLEDGTRVHVVREELKEEPTVIANAIIISERFYYDKS